jgi:hypothetical protein
VEVRRGYATDKFQKAAKKIKNFSANYPVF